MKLYMKQIQEELILSFLFSYIKSKYGQSKVYE